MKSECKIVCKDCGRDEGFIYCGDGDGCAFGGTQMKCLDCNTTVWVYCKEDTEVVKEYKRQRKAGKGNDKDVLDKYIKNRFRK